MKEFRERVLIPLLIPLGALAINAMVVLNISRVLLALEERSGPHTVVAVAIIIASSVLFGCTYMSSRGEERSAGTRPPSTCRPGRTPTTATSPGTARPAWKGS